MTAPDSPSPHNHSRALLIVLSIVAVALLALIAILAVVLSGGDDPAPTTTENTEQASPIATQDIKGIFTRATRSASVTGNALGTAATAKDVARVGAVARRQLTVVTDLGTELADVRPAAGDQAAYDALVDAVNAQRKYLTQLVRVTSQQPAQALRQLPVTARNAAAAVAAYRTFLERAPGYASAITNAGLADVNGLRLALRDKMAAATPDSGSSSSTPVQPTAPAGASGFVSPAGTTTCGAVGDSVVCRAAPGTIGLDQYGGAYLSGGSPGSGYGVLAYGQTWSNGAISCSIDRDIGTMCSNASGDGFRLRLQDYDLNW